MEMSNLPETEFKVIIIKMLCELRRRMGEHSEKCNKEKIFKKSSKAEE